MIPVTGIGAVSAMGDGVEALLEGLLAGRSPWTPAPWGAEGLVARVPGSPTPLQMARRAALEALGDADVDGLAVVGASTAGHMRRGEQAWRQLAEEGVVDDVEGYVWSQLCHDPTRRLHAELGATGPCLTLSTACTSGAAAIGVAGDLLRTGRARRALVVGYDGLCRTTLEGFSSLRVRSPGAPRPFDVDRDGMGIGEGAGALLLDPEGAPLAHLVGYANRSDAHHLTAPDPEGRGARAAIRAALQQADLHDVDFVCAHATGTELNDAMEARVLAEELPSAATGAYKGAIGHVLGGAATLEAVICVLAMQRGVIPPCTGLSEPMPEGLDLVRSARVGPVRSAISVNFAFGGNNTAIVLRRAK